MSLLRLAIACCLLPAPSFAQQDPGTGTQDHQAASSSSRPVDEGPGRYPIPAIDPSQYVPVPLPVYHGVQTPEGVAGRPVVKDLVSGVETVFDVPASPFVPSAEVAGWARSISEAEPETWGNLSQINSAAFPWSAACRVFFTQAGTNYLCSGTLIDERHVITAGHCVNQGNGGQWSTNVVVYPAWNASGGSYGAANGIQLASWTDWTVSGSFNGDVGWIRLDRPVGALTGWMGYGYNSDDNFYRSTTFNMAGYPGNSGCWSGAPNQLYYGSGLYDQVFSRTLRANTPWTCTIGGMSGTGVYYISGSNRYVHGNVSNEATNFTDMGHCRMVQAYYNFIHDTFFPGGYPTTQIDLVPLDVNASTPVRAGSALTSLDYLVTNASLYDPPSATYSVSVYLSTNNVITTFDTLLQTHSFTWDFAQGSSARITVSVPPAIPFATTPGTYYVGIILNVADANTGNNASDGWDAAQITVQAPLHPNDECSGAFAIANGTNGPFDNVGATDSLPAWTCGGVASHDLWYRYVAPCTGYVTLDTCGSAFDTKIDVLTGSCGSTVVQACNDDACGLQSRLTFVAIAGTTYYVRVGGYIGSEGSFTLNVACQAFANDGCTGAVPLNLGRNGPFTNVGSTNSAPPFPCGFNGGPDVWFSFNSPFARSVTVDTCSAATTFDTELQVFAGSCGALVALDCNDDTCGLQSTVHFMAQAATTYHVRVGGYNGRTGTFEVNVTATSGAFLVKETGCGPTTVTATGTPTLGTVVGFQLGGLTNLPLLWIGAEVDIALCPGCRLGATLGITFPGVAIPPSMIPNDTSLLGGQFAVQGADLLSPNGCASPMATLSDTVLVTVG